MFHLAVPENTPPSREQSFIARCKDENRNLFENGKLIVQYHRKKNQPRGVVVAFKDNNEVRVGWSLCRKCDKFDRHMGIHFAANRAESIFSQDRLDEIPHSLRQEVGLIVDKAKRRFKIV